MHACRHVEIVSVDRITTDGWRSSTHEPDHPTSVHAHVTSSKGKRTCAGRMHAPMHVHATTTGSDVRGTTASSLTSLSSPSQKGHEQLGMEPEPYMDGGDACVCMRMDSMLSSGRILHSSAFSHWRGHCSSCLLAQECDNRVFLFLLGTPAGTNHGALGIIVLFRIDCVDEFALLGARQAACIYPQGPTSSWWQLPKLFCLDETQKLFALESY